MYYFGLILCMISLAQSRNENGACFQFPGKSYLKFQPNNFNTSDRAHYSLLLQTQAEEGVVMYAESSEDFEALYLSQGKLIYLLINPTASGVGGTTGGVYTSNQEVNNGTWLAVDIWRNWETKGGYHQAPKLQTGLKIRNTASGQEESHMDDIYHRGVRLSDVVYFGGVGPTVHHPDGLPQDFKGKIKEIYEESNDQYFTYFALNFDARVTFCNS